jgi:hypothetical protein
VLTITRYACEFCDTEYESAKDALECEALGFPEPMPFLKIGVPIPAFGEHGITSARITQVLIGRGYMRHIWLLEVRPFITTAISHNLDPESPIPVHAFDPRRGVDAFRYGCSASDLATWERTMREYGFDESEASAGVLAAIEDARETVRV